MFCKQCGNELKEGAAFCINCGAQQKASIPAQNIDPDFEKTVSFFDPMPGAQPVVAPPVQQPVVVPPVQQPVVSSPAQQPVVAPPTQQYSQPNNASYVNDVKAHNGKVGFFKAIVLFFKNYVNFSGRASRSEYWWAFLFNMIVSFIASLISTVVPPLGGLISLAFLIPGISLTVRRLHDTGKSGAYCFMGFIPIAGPIILIVRLLKDSDGDNQWGPGGAVTHFAPEQQANPVNSVNKQKVVTNNDIYIMAKNHAPFNLNSSDAKRYMDAALSKIVPAYTGSENLAAVMMRCDPQEIKANIIATDTDTLLVVFKALDYYISQGGDNNVLGIVQQNVLSALKTRF